MRGSRRSKDKERTIWTGEAKPKPSIGYAQEQKILKAGRARRESEIERRNVLYPRQIDSLNGYYQKSAVTELI